jgi:hypothetical protein
MQLNDKDIENNYNLTFAKRNRAAQYLDVRDAVEELESKITEAQAKQREYREGSDC